MFLVLFLSLVGVFLFHQLYWKRRNLPPGPTPLSFLGNLLSLNNPPPGYEALERWAKEYGPVFTIWVGPNPFVCISSYEKIKETFVKDGDTYVDKHQHPTLLALRGGSYGVADTNGAQWREHRKFAMSNLKDFGMGKNLMQEKIIIEIQDMFKKFDESDGVEMDVPLLFDFAVANVINQVVMGYRFEGEKEGEFRELKTMIKKQQTDLGGFIGFMAFVVPALVKFIPGLDEKMKTLTKESFAMFHRQIAEHKKTVDYENDENSDFVDAFLKEKKKREAEGDFESFCDMQLANMCWDLWFAGLETTTTTITWALALILNDENGVQDKLHEELDRVIDSDRIILNEDKNDLPYMTAFINECQRYVNLVPLNAMHSTTRDTTINGYDLPKGTGVVAQISTVMNDENVFPDHNRFNPDRFIENGKLKKVEELIPFSIGKRQSLGEGLARMELFLFIANFFNRYEIVPSSEGPPSLSKSLAGFVIPARQFNGIVKRRK